jgi:formamidopyrimidine-DNA glycosylase
MPELPEVETMRRGIAAIVGGRIADVWRPRCRLRPITIAPRFGTLRRRVVGRKVTAVGRAGKRVLVELDSGDRIVFEPRMTGRLLLAEPPDREHLRLVFELSGGRARQLMFWNLRGLGVVRLMSPRQFARELGPEKLGPDALDISAGELRRRLATSRRAIKVALMDQRAVAGIGNLYASETLHLARLHPELRCDQVRPAEWTRLHSSIREVLQAAVLLEGSTLSDGTYRNPENRAGAYQSRHRVYRRAGQRCVQCGKGRIVRLVQAQRSTFFCPVCQRRRDLSG